MTTDSAVPSRIPTLLAVVVTAVLWGTTGTAATFAEGVGPLAIGAFSLGIGGLLQAAIAVPAPREQRQLLRNNWKLVVLGGLAVFTYPLAFYSSMHVAGVTVGTVVSLASAFSPWSASWSSSPRPTRRRPDRPPHPTLRPTLRPTPLPMLPPVPPAACAPCSPATTSPTPWRSPSASPR